MGVLVPQGILFPLKFDQGFIRVSTLSRFQATARTSLHAQDPIDYGSVSVKTRFHGRFFPVPYAGRTDKEGFSVSSEEMKPSVREGININNLDDIEKITQSVFDQKVKAQGLAKDKSASIRTVGLWVCAAVAFGIGVSFKEGIDKASEFFAGYLLEQSLSVDNLFVFVLVFKYFKVPLKYQSTVLSYGIAGAIIFRASLILLGTATLQRFESINLLLAMILLYSSYKLFDDDEDDEDDLSNNFIVKTCQKFIPVTSEYDGDRFITLRDGLWKATPLLLTVAVIELSDIAFAVDSIPAVFGVTRDPLIVFSSNLFAILGLRSLYVIISESMSDLEYIQPAIAVVLGFIGFKMIFDYFGFHISTEISLSFVAVSLFIGVIMSLLKKPEQKEVE